MSITTDPNIFKNILSKKAYTADYEKKEFTVTWKNWDGSTLKTEAVGVYLGATPPITTPTKEDATFTGWLPSEYSYITESVSIVAQFKDIPIVMFTVTWANDDGSVLKTETVRSGRAATPPEDPTKEGYLFGGWDVAYDNITKDTTIKAKYNQNGLRPYYLKVNEADEPYKVYLNHEDTIDLISHPFKTVLWRRWCSETQRGNATKIHLEYNGEEIPYSKYKIELSNTILFKVSSGVITRIISKKGLQTTEEATTKVTITYNDLTIKLNIVVAPFKIRFVMDWSEKIILLPIYVYNNDEKINLLEEDFEKYFKYAFSYERDTSSAFMWCRIKQSETEVLDGVPLRYMSVELPNVDLDKCHGSVSIYQDTDNFGNVLKPEFSTPTRYCYNGTIEELALRV